MLTLADAGLISEEVEEETNPIANFTFLLPQVKWRILAYGINEEEFGPNMAFFLCSRASLRFHFAIVRFCFAFSLFFLLHKF